MMSIVEEQHPEKSQLLTELASILDKESLSRVAVYWKKEFTKDMHGQVQTNVLKELWTGGNNVWCEMWTGYNKCMV